MDLGDFITVYDNCCSCIDLQCYTLTPCEGQIVTEPIVTKTDLAHVVGKVIRNVTIHNQPIDPTICWTVSGPTSCTCPTESIVTLISTSNPYEDCVCCLPASTPEPLVLPERVIPKPVKNYTRTEFTQCDIDANVDFAQVYWNLTKKYRFGISTCEWNKDISKLWVKKKLSDLSFKLDPNFCIVTIEDTICTNHQQSFEICGCNPIFAGMPCR